LIQYRKAAAIIHQSTGDITQLAAIFHIVGHDTIENQSAPIQAHITHQTIE
jgi:hypothetical protein